MTSTTYKTGYCKSCMSNVRHRRSLRSPFFPGFDLITLRIFKSLGLGPWYCIGCGHKRLLVSGARAQAGTFEPGSAKDPQPEGNQEEEVERVGNYLRTDHSLVDQTTRKSRYSTKFRDGIARRVLTGRSTKSQASRDLGIREIDVQIWIDDFHQRNVDRELADFKPAIEGRVTLNLEPPQQKDAD